MRRHRICASIIENDYEAVAGVERFVDFYELRLDLIGDGWQEWAGKLNKPWIACNRLPEEGGKWSGSEVERIGKLYEAVKLGARIVDIEMKTENLSEIVEYLKKKKIQCLISMHNLEETPDIDVLKKIVRKQLLRGADICKVATTAKRFEDNLTLLRLFPWFPGVKLVTVAMGDVGVSSRVLSPMLGGYFTYASVIEGKESAPGQLTAAYLRSFYEATRHGKD